MKAKLDFDNKTIELEAPVTLAELTYLQKSLKDWTEWRIVPKVENGVTAVCVPAAWDGHPEPQWGTRIDTSGGKRWVRTVLKASSL